MMATRLLSLRVRNRRDVILVRHRARQIASLLGYSPVEQAFFAAAAFELGRRARHPKGCAFLHFETTADRLIIEPEVEAEDGPAGEEPLLRLERPLPPSRPELGHESLPLVVHQLMQLTPLDLFKEIERQNTELLRHAAALLAEAVAVPPAANNSETSAA